MAKNKPAAVRRIAKFDGLYGERGTQPDAEYLFSELLETRSRDFDWDIPPHIHPRLYQVFFVKNGTFTFYEASGRQQVESPCLLLIPPTWLHGFSYEANTTGRILTVSDKLVESLFPGSEILVPMLGKVQCLTTFPEPHSPKRLQALIETIDEELFNSQAEKRLMLYACLQQLFLIIYRLWQKAEAVGTEPNDKSLVYFRKVQQRIREVGTTHGVAQLAGELLITPVHLNRICRAIAGKSASALLQEHILEEARKYLTYTSYTVSEIAYLLNFEYPNYFARFFRKHTGLSPKQFRKGKRT